MIPGVILQVKIPFILVFFLVIFLLQPFSALEEPEVLVKDIISFSENCLNFGNNQKKEL